MTIFLILVVLGIIYCPHVLMVIAAISLLSMIAKKCLGIPLGIREE